MNGTMRKVFLGIPNLDAGKLGLHVLLPFEGETIPGDDLCAFDLRGGRSMTQPPKAAHALDIPRDPVPLDGSSPSLATKERRGCWSEKRTRGESRSDGIQCPDGRAEIGLKDGCVRRRRICIIAKSRLSIRVNGHRTRSGRARNECDCNIYLAGQTGGKFPAKGKVGGLVAGQGPKRRAK
jgi:hypothetical protein